MCFSQDKRCESHFWLKVMTKNGLYHFYPSAKSRRGLKIKTSGVIFRGASAYHVQKTIAPPKQAVCQFSDKIVRRKTFHDAKKINRHFLKNYDRRPRKNYDWIGFWNESWDVRHNSSKNGVLIILFSSVLYPGWKTPASWLEDICVLARKHFRLG